jgi:two-component system, OmpR family, sensor histidine kinase VicK
LTAVKPPDSTSGERTEIVYGIENVTKFSAYGLSKVEKSVDVCGDYSMPSVILASEQVKQGYYELNKRGVKIRWITDITKDNLYPCKEISKIAELRHLDGVKGGFVLSDQKIYVATAQLQMEEPVIQLIYSNVKALVEQHQYMFNALWNKAIPSKQRMREIEEDQKREFIETIQDPVEIVNLIPRIISSAIEEITILFSTLDSVKLYHKLGILELLTAMGKRDLKDGLKIRMLVNNNDRDTTNLSQEFDNLGRLSNVVIQQHKSTSVDTKITLIIVDKQVSLAIELKDDTKTDISDALGLATYSNSKSTVLSYESIFETLWVKSELDAGLRYS